MNVWQILQYAIWLLKIVVARTTGTTDDAIVSGVEAALKELEKVRGTEVTKAQLESLRVDTQW